MNDVNPRDAKLIQYLNEAYAKEKELERALEGHIQMTTRAPYKKRLQDHLRETKSHATTVSRRIKQLGGTAEEINVPGPGVVAAGAGVGASVVQQATAVVKGGMHAVRGTSGPEKMLKNAKTEAFNEEEEIANYTAIEALANTVGDKETARLARDIRRQEERMRGFLERLIPQLSQAVAKEEIPAQFRNGGTTRRRSSRSRSTGRARTTTSRSNGKRSTSRSSSSARSSSARSGSARSGSARSGSGSARSTGRSAASRSTSRSASSRATGGSRRSTSASARTKKSGSSARSTRSSRSSGSNRGRSS
jgi:ferritin-like metal-binding protein YciE